MRVTLPTARLAFANDGIPLSPDFNDLYHSVDGGLAQARAVFLAGNRVAERWRGRDSFTILETGFGLGINFLAAWDALRADPNRPRRLHFISVEKHPFTRDDLKRALAPFEEVAPLAGALVMNWPPPVAGFHRIHFDAGQVILTLLLGDATEALAQLEAKVDAFFLDGFSPAKNPGVWSPEVVRELARLAAPGATLATWTVAGGVRAALTGAGFTCEKREGFGHKRAMMVGQWREPAVSAPTPDRRALVLGAGVAGIACAERLASRGWEVALVDAREQPHPLAVGAVRPVANLRDATNAKVSRSAFLYALQHYGGMQLDGHHLQWQACGALQLAGDDDEAARQSAIVHSQEHAAEFLAYVDREAAAEIAGRDVARGGWYFPSSAWVSLRSLATASLARAGSRVHVFRGDRVERIVREGNAWRALGASGSSIAEAPVLILANAHDAQRLAPEARLALNRVRGQVTYLPPSPSRSLERIVSGNGYIAPLPDGGHVVGATFQHDDFDETVRAADHGQNLARAESMLPGFTQGVEPSGLEGWTGFRTTVPDRLPIFGACVAPGLYVATGLGSRGLLWAPLGAELLVSRIESEPSPLPRDLAGAISPARFLS
ncbi:bifunctional tRNA (5-methylaminomethyl-2-thiouridine)(34)-methyltransferase MnmD/FAD-dependent 5-carboxymethylaminomethyl-2-thiouridine(34) oxidoreductase MnmC [Usitatibacter palustris]|uniref:tRNA 5-methylaminomethyl-2-thiouridine biosynthesis bifunctional protein MnmC n=1 Tax=Usitatibacter palustris TaxID=2732487 RepID=A0A6M4H2G9_9PROT|nr:bifunctional tRNA (5-methylaminomethyl-2-thiouridine)(34)-methyltransferase MnmD/FAD-dependent 5-carboxymethylaminomethyl-2-thiouridine(34) oxidoreductase MnmC [Usitatibacter palustris]QJR13741.1 tRNA 5-methylaminomethyl-2-thiouridine biosynthesis bifunctional protein MnmC [Usitatibacter palustris]